ncbi:MAG: helix-turn-helix domain-containing protein [Oligoflexus sp.]
MSDLLKQLVPKSKARKRKTQRTSDLAEQIKSLRIERGLTQEELAEDAGVGVAQIRKLEQGQSNVNLTTLLKLLKALKGSIQIVDNSQ